MRTTSGRDPRRTDDRHDIFKHSTPDLYDRYMVPLLFESFARVVSDRVAGPQPWRILETAAGTGVLTTLVSEAAPNAEIVATDINPGVVGYAAKKFETSRVTLQQANAQECRSMTPVSTWSLASSA